MKDATFKIHATTAKIELHRPALIIAYQVSECNGISKRMANNVVHKTELFQHLESGKIKEGTVTVQLRKSPIKYDWLSKIAGVSRGEDWIVFTPEELQ